MSSKLINRQPGGFSPDLGELGGAAPLRELKPVMRQNLQPEQEAASLPPPPSALPSPVVSLTRHLGPSLTFANRVWSGDPVDGLRGLQGVFVKRALELEEHDRGELMAAIRVVETAVQLRLRLQQMRMTEAEMQIKPEEGKKP